MKVIRKFLNRVYNVLSRNKKSENADNGEQYDNVETLTVPDIKNINCDELKETMDDTVAPTEQPDIVPPLMIDEECHQETCKKEDTEEQHEIIADNNAVDLNIDADSLLQNICNVIDYLDDKGHALATQPGDKVWEFVRAKLIGKLKLSGVSVINDEETLDWLRHKPIEVIEMPEEGCPIEETVYPGVCLGEKVYLRAVVKLKQK